MSDTNNFQSIKDVIANIRKVMSSNDTTDLVTDQQDTSNEILNLEDPENIVELNNIQCARNTLSEINQTFQAMADFSTTVPISPVSQINIKPDIEVAMTREKIYPDQLSSMNQFISIEQSSQKRRLTTKHTISEGLSKIEGTASSEIKEIHHQNLLSPENVFASSEEIKKLITQIHHYTTLPSVTAQDKSPTIEELVISILKPELSTWLNNNLQKVVQDIVEREIKHIVKKSNQG
ncbi:DUF2497 domain-containing protein [Ehrlichia ruminantium]|uniref:DUF2497 domain-containing protein n=1 Tax=Ehrlichia ruminantium (strain Welgevonden) TaxID=254945 RepID=A0A0H3M1Z5_EHRRW|nr:DUF2497 domain-containing protein [Ehrlichia ruminantium]KYW97267.1 hypothetical protein AUR40_00250 [Ehrlichia ruminantium]QLK50868.1 DUF2497 domain-containing protein [Ehrlichia ruminantium]QLK51790.1 DUF2497 domain-containing protein [Ehrlichia ruminantium]QLK53629.1 DUF2497 domain-containing protein [Ehrlichia ruminantium]QLK55466.1 DUF2497 domain-containing protein [Ehrlichia ruminantium]